MQLITLGRQLCIGVQYGERSRLLSFSCKKVPELTLPICTVIRFAFSIRIFHVATRVDLYLSVKLLKQVIIALQIATSCFFECSGRGTNFIWSNL